MYSSKAIKNGVLPPKPIKEMTGEELKEFRNSLNADSMGFDGHEGMEDDDK